MKANKLPQSYSDKGDEPPKYEFNFDIINKQIDKVRTSLLEVGKDGQIDPNEYKRILIELQILEKLLISFRNTEFIANLKKSRDFYDRISNKIQKGENFMHDEYKYGFIQGTTHKSNNIKILSEKHILEYFGALIELANWASFKLRHGSSQ